MCICDLRLEKYGGVRTLLMTEFASHILYTVPSIHIKREVYFGFNPLCFKETIWRLFIHSFNFSNRFSLNTVDLEPSWEHCTRRENSHRMGLQSIQGTIHTHTHKGLFSIDDLSAHIYIYNVRMYVLEHWEQTGEPGWNPCKRKENI